MTMCNLALSFCAGLALAAAGCAAPDSQAPSAPAAQPSQAAAETAAQSAAPTQVATAANAPAAAPAPAQEAPMRDLDKLRKLEVRTGGPLPPQVLPTPPRQDQSCRTDADCGNAGASGASTGGSPDCGNERPCRCVDGSCIVLAPALDPPVDPAPQPPEQR